jgi:nicotinamide-nucleotide amidase
MSFFSNDVLALAERVITENRAAGRRIVLAESCTGGLVASALTEIAGSSDVLECSFVTYSNEAKQQLLGVNPDLLETFGAVSIAVAWAMAQGAITKSRADVSVAISGIAGPGGGSDKKPVGTVVFARAERGGDPEDVTAERRNFDPEGTRSQIRKEALLCALELLLPTPKSEDQAAG